MILVHGIQIDDMDNIVGYIMECQQKCQCSKTLYFIRSCFSLSPSPTSSSVCTNSVTIYVCVCVLGTRNFNSILASIIIRRKMNKIICKIYGRLSSYETMSSFTLQYFIMTKKKFTREILYTLFFLTLFHVLMMINNSL